VHACKQICKKYHHRKANASVARGGLYQGGFARLNQSLRLCCCYHIHLRSTQVSGIRFK